MRRTPEEIDNIVEDLREMMKIHRRMPTTNNRFHSILIEDGSYVSARKRGRVHSMNRQAQKKIQDRRQYEMDAEIAFTERHEGLDPWAANQIPEVKEQIRSEWKHYIRQASDDGMRY